MLVWTGLQEYSIDAHGNLLNYTLDKEAGRIEKAS